MISGIIKEKFFSLCEKQLPKLISFAGPKKKYYETLDGRIINIKITDLNLELWII